MTRNIIEDIRLVKKIEYRYRGLETAKIEFTEKNELS